MKKSKPEQLEQLVMTEPMLLDIRGAARALSSTVWAVRGLLWDKQIPYIKIGRKFLIDPADLRSFIQRKKEPAVPSGCVQNPLSR
jgi:hypothetical protein